MGNNSTALRGLDPRYKELGLDEHELLSTLIVVQDSRTQEKLLIKQMNFANDSEYSRIFKALKQRKGLNDRKIGKYLVRVRDVEGWEQNEICGKAFRLLLYLQFLSGSLKSIEEERVRTQRGFEEEELLGVVRAVVSGLIIMHDNNYKNVHLSKESIMMTYENVYKMIDTQLCNQVHPYFEVLNGVPTKTGTYLAPELLADLRKAVPEFYPSPKADLFTLAVIILELATLTPMDAYYNYDQKTVNISGLHRKVDAVSLSEPFQNWLHCMLEEQEEDRVGLLSLKEMLTSRADTQTNQELCAYSSVADISRKAKQSARTFISRSNRSRQSPSHRQNADQPRSESGNNNPQPHSRLDVGHLSRPVSQPNDHLRPVSTNTHSHLQLTATQLPTFVPIHSNAVSAPARPKTVSFFRQAPSLPIHSIQTPRGQAGQQFSIPQTKQFDTPVNLLLQAQPETRVPTPIDQIEEECPPDKQSQDRIFSNANFGRKDKKDVGIARMELTQSRADVFRNKTYGQLGFGNGTRYEGEFNHNGKFQGNGILYYPNARVCYSGSWKDNSFHGFGVLHSEHPCEDKEMQTNYKEFDWSSIQWLYYQGQFKQDRKEGFGTLYMGNGDKFSGCFRDDAIQGFGSFYHSREQKTINGIWQHNRLKH